MHRRFKLINAVVFSIFLIILIGAGVLVFGRVDETVEAKGIVAPAHYERIRSQIDGIVDSLFVEEGTAIQKGDTLLTLQSDELELAVTRAKTAMDKANADLLRLREEHRNLVASESFETQSAFASLYQAEKTAEIAREKYERAVSLHEENLISAEEKKDRELEYEVAQSYYLVLKERAELLQSRYLLQIGEKEEEVELTASEHEHALDRLSKSTIVAPISGDVLTSKIEELAGEKVTAGEVILEIGDLSQIDFVAQVAEIDIPQLELGQRARVFLNAFPHREYKVFSGTVVSVSRKPEQTAGGIVLETKVRIDDPWVEVESSPTALIPGLSGRVEIITRSKVRLLELLLGFEL